VVKLFGLVKREKELHREILPFSVSHRKGYAFSYDDVNPSGEDHSGTVSTRGPLVLAIRVGGGVENVLVRAKGLSCWL